MASGVNSDMNNTASSKAPAASVAGAFSWLVIVKGPLVAIMAVLGLTGCSDGPVDLSSPADVYNNYCFACHDTGAAGAPRLDQVEFWQQVAGETERLYQNTLKGIRAMPRKGTCLACSDDQLKQTVDWMLEQSAAQASP
jgi:cytochrome c5